MLRATYLAPETGKEIEVEILSADKASATAVVKPARYQGSGYWWDNTPEIFCERFSLSNIRAVCPSCGEEYYPRWQMRLRL